MALRLYFIRENDMINGIKKDRHGIIDYIYVPVVLAAPKLAGFQDEHEASAFCRTAAVVVLCYTLCTDAKWGIIKVIPYKTHAALDFSSGLAALAAPFFINIPVSKRARNTLLMMGFAGIVVGVLSMIGARKG